METKFDRVWGSRRGSFKGFRREIQDGSNVQYTFDLHSVYLFRIFKESGTVVHKLDRAHTSII